LAVTIRLRRMGTKGKPFYRLVVADSRTPRDGRFIEILGYYDPRTEPPTIKIDEEKALLWLNRGAQPSDTVAALLKKQEILQKFLAAKEKKAVKAAAVAEKVPAVEQAEPEPEVKAPKRTRKASTSAKPKATKAKAKAKPAKPKATPAEVTKEADSAAAQVEQTSEEQG